MRSPASPRKLSFNSATRAIIRIMLSLLRWLARRPLRLLHALGAALGWLVWLLSPHYRRRLADHAALAGAGAHVRRAVAEAGRMSLETARLWLRPAGAPLPDPVQWEGEALVEQALAAGRGLVLLTPHLGSFEVCAQAYAERFGARRPLTVLYRPARNAWLPGFVAGLLAEAAGDHDPTGAPPRTALMRPVQK